MHIVVYQSRSDDNWYWHAKASNGKIVTDAESFPSKGNALRAAKSFIKAVFKKVSGTMTVEFKVTKSGDDEFVVNWSAY